MSILIFMRVLTPFLRGRSAIILLALTTLVTQGSERTAANAAITTGQRVFTCGHSFHAFYITPILSDLAQSAGIVGHQIVWRVEDRRLAGHSALECA